MDEPVYYAFSTILSHWIHPEEILITQSDRKFWTNAFNSNFDEWKVQIIMNSFVAKKPQSISNKFENRRLIFLEYFNVRVTGCYPQLSTKGPNSLDNTFV